MAWTGTGPFFGRKSCLAKKASAENMDLSPFAAGRGTGPFFGRKSCLAKKASDENMDLSPFAAQGGQSHFRGENVDLFCDVRSAAKIGTVPWERLRKLGKENSI